jgi:hypothetical protein
MAAAQSRTAADKKMFEIVSGIVLAQARKSVPDSTIGKHHLETEREIARVAVSQHACATGIGRKIAADPCRSLGAEAEREKAIDFLCGFLTIGEDNAGLNRHRIVQRIDVTNGIHPCQAENDLATVIVGRRAATKAGITPLGNDGCAAFGANFDDFGDLICGRRSYDHRRTAFVIFTLVDYIGSNLDRIGDQAFFTDHRCDAVEYVFVYGMG